MPTELLNAEKLAERLGVSESTVKRWSRTKRIPVVPATHQTRLYDWEEVVEALKEQRGKEKPAG